MMSASSGGMYGQKQADNAGVVPTICEQQLPRPPPHAELLRISFHPMLVLAILQSLRVLGTFFHVAIPIWSET